MTSLAPALLAAALLTGPALAQQKADDHSTHHAATPTSAANSAEMADGEVRRIDKGAGKITLRHGEIKNLDMPSMTMVFQLKEPALLDKVKVGDKVRFRAEKSGTVYVVTAIDVAR